MVKLSYILDPLTVQQVTAQSTPYANKWPLLHVRDAHLHLKYYNEQIQSWTGTSRRLLTWMVLLQAKAEYNGGTPRDRYTIFEKCRTDSSSLIKSMGDPFRAHDSSIDLEDQRTSAELAYDTINQPALDFHLRAQSFTTRIIALDKYHHKRGTLATEYEILQVGHSISGELHALWKTRPPIFQSLADPDGLAEVLQPGVAQWLIRNMHVYIANYWAQFIYLHRVAFVIYPATDDVRRAVNEILMLARDLARQVQQQADNRDSSLPATMLWPLFMTGLECDASERAWILENIRRIRGMPNVDKAAMLLEEVLKRQDASGERVDHRTVRRELFDSELSVVY